MNSDVEELLREGMDRFTRDLRVPAGITGRAARQLRRRRVLPAAAGGVAALTAGAVALVVVLLPGAGGAGGPAILAADMVKHVDSALGAAEPGDIAQMMITTRGGISGNCLTPLCRVTPGGPTARRTAEEWSYGDRWRSVSYSSAGHPVYDEGSNAASIYTLVSYATRTWARLSGFGRPVGLVQPGRGLRLVPALGPRGCAPTLAAVPGAFQPGLPGVGFSASSPPATLARDLRAAISCGALRVAGRQRIDGIDATKLTSRPGSPIAETIWLNPASDLPIRVVMRLGRGARSAVFQLTADISWLRPTRQNLTKLNVPIPAGFRHVSLPAAVGLTLLQIPGAPLAKLGGFCLAPAPAGPSC